MPTGERRWPSALGDESLRRHQQAAQGDRHEGQQERHEVFQRVCPEAANRTPIRSRITIAVTFKPEFTATRVRESLGLSGVNDVVHRTGIAVGEPLRGELLSSCSETSDWSGKSSIRCWRPMVLFVQRQDDNTIRPHRALGYRPTAPETRQPCAVGGANTSLRPGVMHGRWDQQMESTTVLLR